MLKAVICASGGYAAGLVLQWKDETLEELVLTIELVSEIQDKVHESYS
jgi:hypothetical protein